MIVIRHIRVSMSIYTNAASTKEQALQLCFEIIKPSIVAALTIEQLCDVSQVILMLVEYNVHALLCVIVKQQWGNDLAIDPHTMSQYVHS